MKHIHIAIETDDDEVARKAQLDAVEALDVPVYRSWVDGLLNGPPHPVSDADKMDALRELLKSAAAQDVPIVVAVGGDVDPTALVVYWPVPDNLITDKWRFRLPEKARAIVAGSQDLAETVRDEAKLAGVRVLA